MDHRRMSTVEVESLRDALRRNAAEDATIKMSRQDTSFIGVSNDDPTDDEVASAIRSVPTHY